VVRGAEDAASESGFDRRAQTIKSKAGESLVRKLLAAAQALRI
jgi:hypothetical protein